MATKKKPPKTLTLPLDNIKAYKVMELLCFHNVTYQGKQYTVWLLPSGSIEDLELEK